MEHVRHKRNVEDEIVPVKPAITGVLLIMCIWGLYSVSSGSTAVSHMRELSFNPGEFVFRMSEGKYLEVLRSMVGATFYQLSPWQFFGSAYFIWVFGSNVETRLGNGRFLLLVLICLVAGWAILGYTVPADPPVVFIGPGLLIASLIGAYSVFSSEKKINPGGTWLESRYKIFRNEPDPDITEGYGISPWAIFVAFVAFNVAMHFISGTGEAQIETLAVVPGLASMVLGLLVCFIIVLVASGGAQGNPLQRLALQKYRHLRKLDLTHEQAVHGAARLLCVPVEKVRGWIGKGGLHEVK